MAGRPTAAMVVPTPIIAMGIETILFVGFLIIATIVLAARGKARRRRTGTSDTLPRSSK
jgi:hypothetical protein